MDLAVKRVEGWMEDESGVKDTILAFKMNSQSTGWGFLLSRRSAALPGFGGIEG